MKWKWIIALACLPFACAKPTVFNTNNTPTFNASLQTQASDQVRISGAIDAAFDDIDSVLAQLGQPTPATLCGANISVDSVDSPRVVSINYNGDACGLLTYHYGHISITYTPGTNWSTPLDTVDVNFDSVMINRTDDTTNILLSGFWYYTNVSGGGLPGPGGGGSVIHAITGINLYVEFDYALFATWQVSRQRNYTYNNGLSVSTSGTDTTGGYMGVSEWGGNRFGNSFITSITTPVVISQGCSWQVTSGTELLYNPTGTTTLNFGVDSSGTPTGCPAAGSNYYFQLSWTGTGEPNFAGVLPY